MIDKTVPTVAEAVAGIKDGDTVLIGGFGESGIPKALIDGVLDLGVTDLTMVTNNAGTGEGDIAALIREGRVRKIICSYPRSAGSVWFEKFWAAGRIELEVTPQGTLSERMRAAGAGLGGFFTPSGADGELADGKEVRVINGRRHVLEEPLFGDVALVQGLRADRWGNVVYNNVARNFGPTMLTAARLAVVEVREIVPLGALDPEAVVSPGIFVDRVVRVGGRA